MIVFFFAWKDPFGYMYMYSVRFYISPFSEPLANVAHFAMARVATCTLLWVKPADLGILLELSVRDCIDAELYTKLHNKISKLSRMFHIHVMYSVAPESVLALSYTAFIVDRASISVVLMRNQRRVLHTCTCTTLCSSVASILFYMSTCQCRAVRTFNAASSGNTNNIEMLHKSSFEMPCPNCVLLRVYMYDYEENTCARADVITARERRRV